MVCRRESKDVQFREGVSQACAMIAEHEAVKEIKRKIGRNTDFQIQWERTEGKFMQLKLWLMPFGLGICYLSTGDEIPV